MFITKYWLIGLVVLGLVVLGLVVSFFSYLNDLNELNAKAEAGDADAQVKLGERYRLGLDVVPQNYTTAVSWFRKAAEAGDAHAQVNLGMMYAKGYGVPEDHAQAVSWFRKAAQQGDAGAQYNLGLMYANGEGVGEGVLQENLVNAYMWVNLAAAQRHKSAIGLKTRIASLMTSAQISQAQRLSDECLAKNYQECGL